MVSYRNRLLLSVSFVLWMSSFIVSQRIIINNSGERIVMYPDGSWRPAETSDSALIRQYLLTSSPMNGAEDLPENDKERNEGEKQEYILRKWNEVFSKIVSEDIRVQSVFRNATNAQFKASDRLKTAEANKGLIESDQLGTLQEEYESSVKKLKEAHLLQKEIKIVLSKAKKVQDNIAELNEKKLNQITAQFNVYQQKNNVVFNSGSSPDPNTSKGKGNETDPTLKNKVADPPLQSPEPKAAKAEPQHNVTGSEKTKPNPKPDHANAKKSNPKPESTSTNQNKKETSGMNVTSSNKADQSKKTTSSPIRTPQMSYDPSMIDKIPVSRKDHAYVASPYECVFTIDTLDHASKRRKLELESSLIFTHTDPDLRPYFKDKDLISCRGHLSKLGPYIYLTLDFQIASSHSQNNFGSLQNESLLRFRLMNGEYISLYNLKSDKGRIDPYTGYTLFSGQYALGKVEIKKLSASSLDKMRVMWSTGFEDYDVYYVDMLINQIHCLLSKK